MDDVSTVSPPTPVVTRGRGRGQVVSADSHLHHEAGESSVQLFAATRGGDVPFLMALSSDFLFLALSIVRRGQG